MILRLVILATAMVGCIPNTDNVRLGSGDVSVIPLVTSNYDLKMNAVGAARINRGAF